MGWRERVEVFNVAILTTSLVLVVKNYCQPGVTVPKQMLTTVHQPKKRNQRSLSGLAQNSSKYNILPHPQSSMYGRFRTLSEDVRA